MIAPELDAICSEVIVQPSVRPNSSCPWCNGKEYRHSNQSLCLHREILDFARWMGPTNEEKQMRFLVIQRFRTAIKLLWPESSIVCHGSSATNTYMPGGDIDFVVINSPENLSQIDALKMLEQHLTSLQTFRKSDVLENARFPIIKGIEKPFGYHVDIAVNNNNGILNIERNKNLIKKHPHLYPLLMVLKFYLFQSRLNEPFRGGISSNTLEQMILFVLQCTPDTGCLNLGTYLISFFHIFGVYFNYITTGMTTRFGGCLFSRVDINRINWKNPINLCVEDPQLPGNMLGENAFETSTFRSKCFIAFNRLKRETQNGEQSLLLRFLNSPDWIVRHRTETQRYYQSLFGNTTQSIPLNLEPDTPPARHNYSKYNYNDGPNNGSYDNGRQNNNSRYSNNYNHNSSTIDNNSCHINYNINNYSDRNVNYQNNGNDNSNLNGSQNIVTNNNINLNANIDNSSTLYYNNTNAYADYANYVNYVNYANYNNYINSTLINNSNIANNNNVIANNNNTANNNMYNYGYNNNTYINAAGSSNSNTNSVNNEYYKANTYSYINSSNNSNNNNNNNNENNESSKKYNDSRNQTDYRKYNENRYGDVLRYNDEHRRNDRRPPYRR